MKHKALQEPKPFKVFRDKYLATCMMVAALLISFAASAQLDSAKYSPINGYGFKYKRHVQDSVSIIPLASSPHIPYRAGGLKYNPSDSTHLLVWSGFQWLQVGSNGTGIDTAYFEDPYLTIVADVDTFNIDLSALGTVDSVRVFKHEGTDSVYTKVNNTESFSFVDNNNFPTSHTFNTATGILATQRRGLTDIFIDLDGRYVETLARRGDSVFVYKDGLEAFVFKDSTGTAGVTALNNVGTGHRLVATPGGNIKTLVFGYGVNGDSTTNANSITVVADTTETNHVVTQSDLNDAIASQNIQQVLNHGDTSNRPIIYKFTEDTTDQRYTFVGIPSNYGVSYGAEGTQMGYSSGWMRANYVNASGRPNVVYNLAMYNTSNGGGRVSTSDAAYRFGLETHFNTGGQRLFEFHLPEMTTYAGAIYRPFTMYMNKETGATQFNYYATAGVDYQNTSGQGLLSFGGLGGLNVFGRPGNLSLLLQDDDGNTYRDLMLEGGGIQHLSYGGDQFFDSRTIFNNTNNNLPTAVVTDNRSASTVGLQINIDGTSAAKYPIQIEANTTGGIVEDFENGTGPNELKVLGNGNALVTVNNVSTTDPAGGGYNAAFSQWITGTDYSFIGMNYGTSAGPYTGTQLFYRTVTSAPHVWYVGSAQMMRLNSHGFGIGTTDPLFGLHVNRSMGINKDSVTHRTTTGARQMLVLDTTTNSVERMAIPSSGSTYTFNNGLTESAGTVKLGGTLSANTTINTGGFTTTWSGSNDNETSFTVDNTGTTSASAILGSTTGTTSVGVTGTSSAYIGVFGTSTTNTGVQGQSSSGIGVIGVSSTAAAMRGQINPSSNNAIENIVTLLRTYSGGAGANGIGSAIQYELETATNGNSQTAGSLAFKWTDATAATRTSAFEIYGVNSATTARKAALAGSGQWTWDGYGAGTFTGTPTYSLQTTSAGAIVEGPVLASGSWSPTLTADVNVDGTPTALHATYTRTGSIVTCYVTVSVDPTLITTQTEVGIPLPIASNFTDANDLTGSGSGSIGNGQATFVQVSANTTSDRATLIFQSGSTSASIVTLSFQYTIL